MKMKSFTIIRKHKIFICLALLYLMLTSKTCAGKEMVDHVIFHTESRGIHRVFWSEVLHAETGLYRTEHDKYVDIPLAPNSPVANIATEGRDLQLFSSMGNIELIDKSSSDINIDGNFAIKIAQYGKRQIDFTINLKNVNMTGGRKYRLFLDCFSDQSDNNEFLIQYKTENMQNQNMTNSLADRKGWLLFPLNTLKWTTFEGEFILPDTGIHNDLVVTIRGYGDRAVTSNLIIDRLTLKMVDTDNPQSVLWDKLAQDKIYSEAINIYNNGVTIPIMVRNLSDNGLLTTESEIIFFADNIRDSRPELSRFNRFNKYILSMHDTQPPNRMDLFHCELTPVDSKLSAHKFMKKKRYEKDSILAHYNKFAGAEALDRAMWLEMRCPPQGTYNVMIPPLHDLAPEVSTIKIEASLWGSSENHIVSENHRWCIGFNGNIFPESTWGGYQHEILTAECSANFARKELPNAVSFTSRASQPTVVDMVTLDWFTISYDAQLNLGIREQSECAITSDAMVISVEDEMHPLWLAIPDSKVVYSLSEDILDNGKYIINNIDVKSSEGKLGFFVSNETMLSPNRITQGKAALNISYEDTEYIILTHNLFIDPLISLRDYRQAQGLNSCIVDVESVYMKYSDGYLDPASIKQFITDVSNNGKLKYVFLVGDATYDYKNIVPGSFNFVPTYHIFENHFDYAPAIASDDFFVQDANNQFTKVAVGRLPSSDPGTIENYTHKIFEYEAFNNERNDFLLIGAQGFTSYCENMQNGLSDTWNIKKIYSESAEEKVNINLQKEILKSIDDGMDLVYFVGHGAFFVWRTGSYDSRNQTDLFSTEHVGQLNNKGRYPIIMTATCFSTIFDAPMDYSKSRSSNISSSGIGIYFVEAPDKGAIACIGHTGKVAPGICHAFCQTIAHELDINRYDRLGDVFLKAKIDANSVYSSGIVLIGDPALRINYQAKN